MVVNAHPGNIITTSFTSDGSSILTGCALKSLSLTHTESGEIQETFPTLLSAPILFIDTHPINQSIAVVSCMNGAHFLIDFKQGIILQEWKDHKQKYAIQAKFSLCGHFFATAGYDETVKIYHSEDGEREWSLKKEFIFKGQVEAIEWMKVGS